MIRKALTFNKAIVLLAFLLALVGEAFGLTPVDGVYQIGSCQDLKDFSDLVNTYQSSSYPNASANAVLTADIDCNDRNFTPIGAYSSNSNVYSGTFDGQGFAISNLNGSAQYYAGLFGRTGSDAVIKNVVVANSTFKSEGVKYRGAGYAGAIVGYNGGTITGCTASDVTVAGAASGSGIETHSGGIVGYNASGTISICSVVGESSIEATTDVGGVVGYNKGTVVDCLAGSKVESVAAKADGEAGGIVGNNAGTVRRCVYTGNYVKAGAKSSNPNGGAVSGAGKACSDSCYYTTPGMKIYGNDGFNDDFGDIKDILGPPWINVGDSLALDNASLYHVTIKANGHGSDEVIAVDKGGAIGKLDSIVVDGYRRDGLCTDATCSNPWTLSTPIPSKNFTLFSNWTKVYKVTFDANGGSFPSNAVTSKYFAKNEVIDADGITEPTFANGTLKGWSTVNDKENPVFIGSARMGESHVTLYAIEELTNFWTITYKPGKNGVGAEVTQKVGKGKNATLKNNQFTREGYAQTSWTDADGGTKKYSFAEDVTVTGDMTLYPVWTSSKYKITYAFSISGKTLTLADGNGKTIPADNKTTGVNLYLTTETFSKSGYIQDGWSIEYEGGKSFGLGDVYARDVADTLYPHWIVNAHNAVFNANGGKFAGDKDTLMFSVVVDDEIVFPSSAPAPARAGCTFLGWAPTTTATEPDDLGNMGSKDKTFYAVWAEEKYAVTYKYTIDGGVNYTVAGDVDSVTAGTANVKVRDNYLKDGYNMTAWTTTDATVSNGKFTMPTKDVVFTSTGTVAEYTITYNLDDGTNAASNPAKYTISTSTITLADASRDGYTFGGWYSETGFVNKVTEIAQGSFGNKTLFAKWTPTSYTITYNNLYEGQTNANPASYTIESETITLQNPGDSTGYTFGGWYADDKFEDAAVTEIAQGSSGDTTLYAKWTVKTHSITYQYSVDGGETYQNAGADPETVNFGTSQTRRQTYVLEGYTMSAWTVSPDTLTIAENGTFTMPDMDVVFKTTGTKNNYTIAYFIGDTQVGDAVSVEFDGTVTPKDTSKTGYTFSGWTWYSLAGEEPEALAEAPVNMPAYNLKAVGIFTANQYTITLNANGGVLATGASPITQEYGSTIQARENPTKVGYTFVGWFENEDLSGDAVAIPATMPAKTYTLYAKWTAAEANYTVKTCTMETDGTYDENKCSSTTKQGVMGTSADATPASFETGFELDAAKSTLTGTVAAEGNLVLSVYIKRIAYTITFVNYDNVQLQKSDFLYGATPVYSAAEPTKAADAQYTYAFAGWNPEITEVTGAAIYTAQFTRTPVSYALAWDFAGGTAKSGYTAAGQVAYGTTLEIPEMEKEGFAFQGWNPEAPETMPANNLTLTATWAPNQYAVKFETNGGSAIEDLTADYGAAITAPTNPTKTGYVFAGWYTDNGTFANEFTFSTMPLNGATVYAKWNMDVQVAGYTGVYDGNAHGISVTAPAGATVTYSSAADGAYVDALTYTEAGEYTVYYKASQEGYADVKGSATVSIGKADNLSVSLEGTSFTYDAGAHALTATATTNAKSGTTTIEYQFDGDGETWVSNLEDLVKVNAGEYIINVKATNTNYADMATTTAKLTIIPKTATVSAVDAGKTLGSKDPELLATVTGVVGEDKLEYVVVRDEGENVGYYQIAPVGAENQGNYRVDYEPARFTISPVVKVVLAKGMELICTESECDADGNIKYTYGKETTLPAAKVSDDESWIFQGLFENEKLVGTPVTKISADVTKNVTLYPYFTKQIEITLSEDPEVKVTITLDNNDNADSVSQKVNEAVAALDPKPSDPTKDSSDKYIYTFKEYECTGTGVDYTCEAKFDSTGRVFEVAENLPEGATLVCTEGAKGAENCNGDKTGIRHQYGVETNPLPVVVIVDGEGKVDETWEFQGWFDNADGIDDGTNGNKVEKIGAEVFGDVTIYPYFTKVIEVVIGDQTVKIVIDDNDTQDSINAKVSEAAKNHDPVIEPDSKHIEKEPFIYDFAGYKCELLESNRYECVPDFDESGKKYEVAVNLSKDAKLLCEGEAAAACNEKGDAIVHQYGAETSPLPSVVIIGKDGHVDESWHFRGWFDNENGIADGSMEGGAGKKILEIAAEVYGDMDIYPYFTKTIQVKIGNEVVDVVIDNNDTQDSISVKATEAAANREPPIPTPTKDKDDKYEYEFAGYVCNQKFVCEPSFNAILYGTEVVVAYGSNAKDTIVVKVLSGDDESIIEEKVMKDFLSRIPELPIPAKAENPMYTYDFEKFVYNAETGCYEPQFKATPRTYKITFNMPAEAKLATEFKGNTYDEETILPQATISGSDWQFKGWYTEENGNGSRVKVVGAKDMGEKEYFAFFQKAIMYEVNGSQGELEIVYSADTSKSIDLALKGVVVNDFEENGRTFTFSKWELKKGVYVAKFTDITAIAQTNAPHFSVIAIDRTLEITGAKMGAKIAVFDLGGRLVTTGIVANGTQLVELANPGSYIVRVNNQVRRVNVR